MITPIFVKSYCKRRLQPRPHDTLKGPYSAYTVSPQPNCGVGFEHVPNDHRGMALCPMAQRAHNVVGDAKRAPAIFRCCRVGALRVRHSSVTGLVPL